MQITLTLADCRKLYEDHFCRELPMDLPFAKAAAMVRDEVGEKQFVKLVEKIGARDER